MSRFGLFATSVLTSAILLGAQANADDPAKKLTPTERRALEAKWKSLKAAGFEAFDAGRYHEAQKAFASALDLARRLYPKDEFANGHNNLARSLRNLAFVYKVQAKYVDAESLYRQALDMTRRLFKGDHADVASRLRDLAGVYISQDKYAQAEPLARDALSMNKRLFKGDHEALADSMSDVASVLRAQSKSAEAERLYRDALDMRRRLYPKQDHSDVADNLLDIALLCTEQGKYADAERMYREALEMKKSIFKGDNPEVAEGLNDFAFLYLQQGRLTDAEPLFRDALAMKKRMYKGDHPQIAYGLSNLASVYKDQWRYADAESCYRDALAMRKRLHKGDYPDVAHNLRQVAWLLFSQGKLAEAEPLFREALAMSRRLFKDDHHQLANSLTSMAVLYDSHGNYEGAEPLQRDALAMQKRLHPEHDCFEVAQSMSALAQVLTRQKKYTEAEPLYTEALAMSKRLYKSDHPDVAFGMNSLAFLHMRQGKLAEAEPLYKDSLAMYRRLYPGQDCPEVAHGSHDLGFLYLQQRKLAEAEPLLRTALHMSRRKVRTFAAQKAEGEALTFIASQVRILDDILTAARLSKTEPAGIYPEVWWEKGAVARVYEQRQQSARAAASNSKAVDLLAELASARRRRAELIVAPEFKDAPSQRKREADIKDLDETVARLDRTVRPLLPIVERAEKLSKALPSELQNALPADTAVVDFVRYLYFEPSEDGASKTDLIRSERYLAFVVTKSKITWVDLDAAEKIEAAVSAWRESITSGKEIPATIPAKVRELVWERVHKELPFGIKALYISPDSALCRVPWAALPGDKPGTILLEEYAIATIPHAPFLLDKLWPQDPLRNPPAGALVVGGVKYDADLSQPAPNSVVNRDDPLVKAGAKLGWPYLPGTAVEATGVTGVATSKKLAVTAIGGDKATSAAILAALPRARYAHFATHGFFADPSFRSVFQLDPKDYETSLRGERIGRAANSPLVMTGLVFAGANNPKTPGRGIITGEALIDLDLSGLDLAVLSACETGLGDMAGGEGAFGLQRAFHLAGARNVIASLWKVPDQSTAALMALFYRNLWEKNLSPMESLRQAQLEMYRNPGKISALAMGFRGTFKEVPGSGEVETPPAKNGKAHPRLWASFTLSGPGR